MITTGECEICFYPDDAVYVWLKCQPVFGSSIVSNGFVVYIIAYGSGNSCCTACSLY